MQRGGRQKRLAATTRDAKFSGCLSPSKAADSRAKQEEYQREITRTACESRDVTRPAYRGQKLVLVVVLGSFEGGVWRPGDAGPRCPLGLGSIRAGRFRRCAGRSGLGERDGWSASGLRVFSIDSSRLERLLCTRGARSMSDARDVHFDACGVLSCSREEREIAPSDHADARSCRSSHACQHTGASHTELGSQAGGRVCGLHGLARLRDGEERSHRKTG